MTKKKDIYLDVINTAKNYVYITTPYLILDDEMVDALNYAALRGVDVRIIMPSIPDKKMVYYLGRSYYYELIKADTTGLAALEGAPKTVYVLAENNTNIPGYEFKDILQQFWNYSYKSIDVLQLDAALDLDIAKLKNSKTTKKDLADILIVPDINVGNAIWKSLTVFGDFTVAGIVWGMFIPCLLNSRGDKKASYYRSLEYGVKILPYAD
mgnify:CR=1 FL=1